MTLIEHIGQSSNWPRRVRQWITDLFGSRYAAFLERELVHVRLDKDKQIAELKAERDRLMEKLLEVKGVPLRPVISQTAQTSKPIGQKTWAQLQAEAIEENARAEAEEAKKQTAKEN